jgi:hypothetical protein
MACIIGLPSLHIVSGSDFACEDQAPRSVTVTYRARELHLCPVTGVVVRELKMVA